MKKKILISLIAVFSISVVAFSLAINVESSPAPTTGGYYIDWNDDACNCGAVNDAHLDWETYHIVNNLPVLIASGSCMNIDPNLIYYIVTISVNITAGDDYIISGRVRYYDCEGACCDGWNRETVKGSDLINDGTFVYITMQ
jgi:hypothetical protein